MKKKFYETKEFQALDRKWSKILVESGFNDSETGKQRRDNYLNKQLFNDKYEHHFERCREFLNSYEFKNGRDQMIFEKYCEGMSVREIEIWHINQLDIRISKTTIHRKIIYLLDIAEISPLVK